MALVIADMLRDVGIDAKVQVWEWGVLQAELLAGRRAMPLGDWRNSTLEPYDIIIPKLVAGERGNFSGHSSRVLESLIDLAEREMRGSGGPPASVPDHPAGDLR